MNFLARQASKAALPIPVQDEMDRGTAMIEKATSDILLGVDWTTNLEIIDMVNRATCDEVTREIVRQVRKRLQHRSPRVVNLALSLAEALVKNCDTNLHREVATPKFMAQMARLARSYREKAGRENLEVADKALELIQSWGETFLPVASTLPLFSQTYHELKREGLPFRKQYDESHVPVLTPPASGRPKPPMRLNTQPDRDLLDSVDTSAGMLRDIMANAATTEDLTDNDLFQEVLEQCLKLVRQVAAAIETKVVEGAEDLEAFFKANDDLQATLQTYERVKDGSLTLPLPRDARFLSNVSADSEPEAMEDFLAGGSDSKPKAADFASVGSGGGAALPKPVAEDPLVPKLPPSRRDSFGKPSNRPSRTSRGNSAAADLLDLSSLDMSDSRPPPPQTAPASFQSNAQAPLFDFASHTNPSRHQPTSSSSSLASQMAYGSGSGLSKSTSAVDPFQAIPTLPPPRTHVSPTFKPPTPQGNFSSAQPLPSPAPTSTGADWLGFGGSVPGSQPSLPLSTSGQGASRHTSGSLSMSGGPYPVPQQPTAFPPPSPSNPYSFPVQTQQPAYSSMGGYPSVPSPSVPPNASQFASYGGYPTQPQVTPMNPLQVSQQAAPVQPQQPQAQQWATFGSAAPQQQQNGQAAPARNPFDTFPF